MYQFLCNLENTQVENKMHRDDDNGPRLFV